MKINVIFDSVDIRVSGLYICVCLEYLLTLGDFFTKAEPEIAPAKTNGRLEKQQLQQPQQYGDATDPSIKPITASSQQGMAMNIDQWLLWVTRYDKKLIYYYNSTYLPIKTHKD